MRVDVKINFIDENMRKIKDASKVDIIKPVKGENDWAIWARLNNGGSIRLTQPVDEKLWLPREPLLRLANRMAEPYYWDNFGIIENSIAINKQHIERLTYVDTRKNLINAYAHFDDKKCILLGCVSKRYFFKKFKVQAEQELGVQFEDITKQAFRDDCLGR